MSSKSLNLTLKVWRQDGPNDSGRFETYESPYDYEEQVLTVVPSDAADPGT